jgi:hypothetical protein
MEAQHHLFGNAEGQFKVSIGPIDLSSRRPLGSAREQPNLAEENKPSGEALIDLHLDRERKSQIFQ